MKGRAIIFQQQDISVREFEPRSITDGEVLIQSEYTAISPGTELRCLSSKQSGGLIDSYVPGYALVGRVVESRHQGFCEGMRVYSTGSRDAGKFQLQWGGHLSLAISGGDDLIEVPENIDPVQASLISLGAISYHGITQSRVKPGDKVIALGLGPIGQLAARFHAIFGAEVVGLDLESSRVEIANAAGIPSRVATDGLKAAAEELMPGGCNILIDSTGVQKLIPEGIDLIAELPWTNDPEIDNRYLIQGSYVGNFSLSYDNAFFKQIKFLIPRNQQKRDREAVLKLLHEGKLSVRDLVSQIAKPEEASEAYASFRDRRAVPGTIVFDWN